MITICLVSLLLGYIIPALQESLSRKDVYIITSKVYDLKKTYGESSCGTFGGRSFNHLNVIRGKNTAITYTVTVLAIGKWETTRINVEIWQRTETQETVLASQYFDIMGKPDGANRTINIPGIGGDAVFVDFNVRPVPAALRK